MTPERRPTSPFDAPEPIAPWLDATVRRVEHFRRDGSIDLALASSAAWLLASIEAEGIPPPDPQVNVCRGTIAFVWRRGDQALTVRPLPYRRGMAYVHHREGAMVLVDDRLRFAADAVRMALVMIYGSGRTE
jgi:hypothetical protein